MPSVGWMIKRLCILWAPSVIFYVKFTGLGCTASCSSFFQTLRKTNKSNRGLRKGAWRVYCCSISSYRALRSLDTHVGVRGGGWESKDFFRVARSVLAFLGSLTAELQVGFLPSPHTIQGGNAHVNLRISNDCETTQARRIYVELQLPVRLLSSTPYHFLIYFSWNNFPSCRR